MERFFWICLAGAAGTGARYLIALWAAQRLGSCTPQECEACLRIRSRNQCDEAILVMKSADDRFREDVMAVSNPVAAYKRCFAI